MNEYSLQSVYYCHHDHLLSLCGFSFPCLFGKTSSNARWKPPFFSSSSSSPRSSSIVHAERKILTTVSMFRTSCVWSGRNVFTGNLRLCTPKDDAFVLLVFIPLVFRSTMPPTTKIFDGSRSSESESGVSASGER